MVTLPTYQLLNVLIYLAVLVANAIAGSGGFSGESIGVIANRYPSAFLPAGWAFAIWSLIYLWLGAFVVYQALPAQRRSGFVEGVGPWWLLNGVLNTAWVVAFSWSRFGIALALMLGILWSLVVLEGRIGAHRPDLSPRDRLLGAWPFALYLSWISVAIIANAFQFVTYLGVDGLGTAARLAAVAMMAVATAVGLFLALRRRVWLFPLVVAWALAAIADRYADDPLLATAGWGLAVTGLLGLAFAARVARGRVGPSLF